MGPGPLAARRDASWPGNKPLRPGRIQDGEGFERGGSVVAVAAELEPWDRRVHALDRQTPGMVDPNRRDHLRGERHRAQDVRHLLELMAGAAVGVVQRRVPAVLAMDVARQRTYPDR